MLILLFSFGYFLASVFGGPCPLDFVAWKKQACFYYGGFDAEIISKDEAKIACLNRQGSTLASLDDAEQEAWLVNDYMMKNDSIKWESSWIGLVRSSYRGSDFKWEDNSTSTYRNWGPGEPNNHQSVEDCTMILLKYVRGVSSYGWNDAVCERTPGFVHQKATGYFCRLPYKEEPFDIAMVNGQQTADPAVFSTNVGLAVTVVILLLAILSVIGYVTWTYRRMILSKLPYLTTKSASTEDLKFDHE